jgi:OOP family OmpA-OmpF porin
MSKFQLRMPLLVAMGLFLIGCAAQQPQKAAFQPKAFPVDQYQKKVDNFLVILDDSTSMSDKYNGWQKVCIAADTVSRMNRTIPDLGFKGAVRTFGQGACVGAGETSMLYGPAKHNVADMEKALGKVTCTGGNTPLEDAIDAAAADLKALGGKTALIIVSDGIVLSNAPVVSAKNLKAAQGANVCIYTVLVGNDPGGKAMMKQIADAGQCGSAVTAEEIADPQKMADFVESALLAKAVKKAEPAPAPAPPPPAKPTPGDADGDGVLDPNDKCPNTPKGARVDERGCWVVGNVLFDLNKADIKKQYAYLLDEVAFVLKNNPNVKVEIQGHTCDRGKKDYNQKLSERRAESVKAYLIGKGIDKTRLTAKGYGLTKPAVPNTDEQARMKNRRVELHPM